MADCSFLIALMDSQLVLGQHFMKSIASKKQQDIRHSIDDFLPGPAVTTVGMMTLLSSWAFATLKNGGVSDPATRSIASDLYSNFITHAHTEKFVFVLDCDHEWQ